MTLTADLVIATAVAYVGLLFLIAYVGIAIRHRTGGFLRSPLRPPLSISVYCTSWTFTGRWVQPRGRGSSSPPYLGPTLVSWGGGSSCGASCISRDQRISIADLVSSRFGKSSRLAVLITILAVIVISPTSPSAQR